jgi:hypothetical protein
VVVDRDEVEGPAGGGTALLPEADEDEDYSREGGADYEVG